MDKCKEMKTNRPDRRVAIIDTGISPHGLIKDKIHGGINIGVVDNKVLCFGNGLINNPESHGTICASIIGHMAPYVKIFSIRVCDSTKGCSLNALIAAIDWAMENKMDIINISLSNDNISDISILMDISKKAYEANIVILASRLNYSHNKNYPADLEYVIGVNQKKVNLFNFIHLPVKTRLYIFRGEQKISETIYINRKYGNNSFMTAFVSGLIANMNHEVSVNRDMLFPGLKQKMKEPAIKKILSSVLLT
jgi:hypothetical protein